MTYAPRVSYPTFERAQPSYFGVPTEELLLDVSWMRQSRLDTIEDPDLTERTRKHTIEYLDHRAEPIIRELTRRHDQHLRHQDDPHVSPWPNATRYEKTLQMARELKASIPLSSYVLYTFPAVRLRKHGSTEKGNCPYPDHQDTGPSFVVYDDNRFTCFGCQRSGDVFTLIAMIDGLERFTDQVASLASWAGLVARS